MIGVENNNIEMEIVLLIDHDAQEVIQQAWDTFKTWLMDKNNRRQYLLDISNQMQLEVNQSMMVLQDKELGLYDSYDVGREVILTLAHPHPELSLLNHNVDYFGRYGSICFTLYDDRYKAWKENEIKDMISGIVGATNMMLKKTITYNDNGLSVYKVEKQFIDNV